ncbi:MAG: hypothetical protein J6Z08_00990 [Elusimicrobiales bacterium]|jgi:hypothetical protein|nr:hypothetical protein [Elusimicrobiales bacterium]
MPESLMILGAWVTGFLTLGIFSFLYKDNPLFKITENLYVGVGMGYYVSLYFFQVWTPLVWEPLKAGNYIVIVPSIMGLLLLSQLVPKLSWLSRYTLTFTIGYSCGLAIPMTINTDLLTQILGTAKPFATIGSVGPMAIFNMIFILIAVLCVLTYFFFSVESRGAVKKVSNVGIYVLMAYFGAAFGNTVMARFSLLYGRFNTLTKYSAKEYFYSTPVLVVLFVAFFVIKHFMDKKKAAAQPQEEQY